MNDGQQNSGIMEDWNNGILNKTKKNNFFLTHYSTIPSFQWYWFNDVYLGHIILIDFFLR